MYLGNFREQNMSFTRSELLEAVSIAVEVYIDTFRATSTEYNNAIARETNETLRIGLMFSKGDALDRAQECAEILAHDTVYRTARAKGCSETIAEDQAHHAKHAFNSKLLNCAF
jgi:hypothetical protein